MENNKVIDDFTSKELPEIIKALEAKTPQAERFLLEIAKLAGLEEAELFDGSVINLKERTEG